MSDSACRAFAEQVLALATSDRGHYRRLELIEQAARECLAACGPPPGATSDHPEGGGPAQPLAEGADAAVVDPAQVES